MYTHAQSALPTCFQAAPAVWHQLGWSLRCQGDCFPSCSFPQSSPWSPQLSHDEPCQWDVSCNDWKSQRLCSVTAHDQQKKNKMSWPLLSVAIIIPCTYLFLDFLYCITSLLLITALWKIVLFLHFTFLPSAHYFTQYRTGHFEIDLFTVKKNCMFKPVSLNYAPFYNNSCVWLHHLLPIAVECQRTLIYNQIWI